jgi:hypothetical protein
VTGIEKNDFPVAELPRQAGRELGVRDRRRGDHDRVRARNRLFDPGGDASDPDEVFFLALDQLDPASRLNRLERSLRSGVEPDVVAPKREIRRRGQAAVPRAEDSDLANPHDCVVFLKWLYRVRSP